MEISQYQGELLDTITYGNQHKIIYPTLALNQTAHNLGEVIRGIYQNNKEVTDTQREECKSRLAECLWCITALANDLSLDLDTIAQENLKGSRDIYNTFVSKN